MVSDVSSEVRLPVYTPVSPDIVSLAASGDGSANNAKIPTNRTPNSATDSQRSSRNPLSRATRTSCLSGWGSLMW